MDGALRTVCQELEDRLRFGVGRLDLPKVTRVQEVATALVLSDAVDLARKPIQLLNSIAAEILDALQQGVALTKKQLRHAAWCLWETTPALAGNLDHLRELLRQILREGKRRLVGTLASVYLSQYRRDRPGLELVSRALVAAVGRVGGRWQDQQQRYALYDFVEGPRRLGEAVLRQGRSATDILGELGLNALGSRSGLAEAITREVLALLENDSARSDLERLQLVRRYALDDGGASLFLSLDQEIANALVLPMLRRQSEPDDKTKDLFLETLIGLFKDPRLNPGRWEKMPSIKDRVIAWLTRQSLRQFLDIVDRITKDPAAANMWRYRRAFWEAVYRKGLIAGAWVVFAEDGTRAAQYAFGKNVQFGRFVKGGSRSIQSNHAVLLLKLGRGIVADWSHNGRVNVWTSAEDRTAPKMYERFYTSDEVRLVTSGEITTDYHLVKTHSSPATYSWQGVVAERIYEITNVRLTRADYQL